LRAGLFSVALVVNDSFEPLPGRYPARRPTVFGLSSPENFQQRLPGLFLLQGSNILTKSVEHLQSEFASVLIVNFDQIARLQLRIGELSVFDCF
jgi:hypothetical protein